MKNRIALLLCVILTLGLCACAKESSAITETSNLSLAALTELAQSKGENLSWSDFESYYSEEIGSGLYIHRYPINEDFYLIIGGANFDNAPLYIRLISTVDRNKYIDIRTESIEDFVAN